jgi:hypothetical protein
MCYTNVAYLEAVERYFDREITQELVASVRMRADGFCDTRGQ